jgi:EAL domain-containing protein (putative c-di-GMP-specific phosphodiesterase class I)/AmiR/NasT family two-component response regulator
MHKTSDLLLILEQDLDARAALCAMAERLGCDHIEPDTADALREVLAIRRPTVAVMAVDRTDTDCLALMNILANHHVRPATLLVGVSSERVIASIKRAAEARGLAVLGVVARPLPVAEIEAILSLQLAVAPPIPRSEIEQAIVESELTLVYQPKVAITASAVKIQGAEALVRWQHPRRGLLQPRHFLSQVEEHGFMSPLTDFVMTEAVRQASQWRAAGLPLEITVNLSTELVQDRGFPERLAVLLQEYDFPARHLVLDVTEATSPEGQHLLLDVFTRLRILGVGLSLDNFGTGQSSLTGLYRMPFSEIKVDHTLIADVPREREARLIVKAIVTLAHGLGLATCAEGVESAQMLDFVRSAGFDSAQGRFFSEPVSAAEIENIVRAWPSSGPATSGSWRVAKSRDFDGATMTMRALPGRPVEGKSSA